MMLHKFRKVFLDHQGCPQPVVAPLYHNSDFHTIVTELLQPLEG